jgi:plasmid stabilization system protein ParE
MVVVWSRSAQSQLKLAYNYIKEESHQNAKKVTDEIIDITISLMTRSEIYPLDKYKSGNDGTYRAFELHRYRITYRVLQDFILIVRMRHTSRSPLSF